MGKKEDKNIIEETQGKETKRVSIPSVITVRDFASKLGLPVSDVISELIKNGVMATINENIDFETAEIIGEYLGFEVAKEKEIKERKEIKLPDEVKTGKERPPIVTILGHVDHGKTTLLDAIRETNIVGGESGGITQHIDAYQVTVLASKKEKRGKKITFIDTPGHEAFETMRAHGAQVNDIAIIIVAADDGVKTQTIEAINHVKKAKTPIIAVINKIDLPNADVNRTKQQLSDVGLIPEDWGGDTVTILISAKTKEGIDDLLEVILLLAEMSKLEANPDSFASGIVLESHLDYGKGPVATVLIKNGTLRIGDSVQVGETYGRIRGMEDWCGKKIKEALPSDPVVISGIKALPQFGEFLQVFSDEKMAKEESEKIKRNRHIKRISQVKKIKVVKDEERDEGKEQEEPEEKEIEELNLVLKTDVAGSLEAIKESLEKLNTSEVSVKVVGEGIGGISESDVKMASASNAIIVGFKVKLSAQVDQLAKSTGVKVSLYNVIYELIDDIREALSLLLPPEIIEITIGKMEILKVFRISKKESIVGGKVTEGKLEKDALVKIMRKKEEIGKAKIKDLKKEKEKVEEAISGGEYGVCLEIDFPVDEKDIIKAYKVEERKRTL